MSNVGPNAAMLSAGGKLTDIGAWYLGEAATGVSPSSPAARTWAACGETRRLALAATLVSLAAAAVGF